MAIRLETIRECLPHSQRRVQGIVPCTVLWSTFVLRHLIGHKASKPERGHQVVHGWRSLRLESASLDRPRVCRFVDDMRVIVRR